MSQLTEPGHELVGMTHPNPDYDTLVLASPHGSYVRELWGFRVGHYYAPPAQLAIEPTAVHDPVRPLAIEPAVQPRKPRRGRAVAAQ